MIFFNEKLISQRYFQIDCKFSNPNNFKLNLFQCIFSQTHHLLIVLLFTVLVAADWNEIQKPTITTTNNYSDEELNSNRIDYTK